MMRRMRAVEEAVKNRDDERWKRSNPEGKARAEGALGQLEQSIAGLEKDLAAARKEQQQAQAKLGNAEFLGKAPEAVVAKITARATAAEQDITRLEGQLAALPVEA